MIGPERFKIPVGIFIILRQDDKILLQLRQNYSFSGNWGFVGRHLDRQNAHSIFSTYSSSHNSADYHNSNFVST